MANVINRTTLVYLPSVNTPDYDPADWIINPDLSALAGVPEKYWKIDGDTVVEMSQAEKDAVDATETAAAHRPPSDPELGATWTDSNDEMLTVYQWNGTKWLSISKKVITFAREGEVIEGVLSLGSVSNSSVGVPIQQPITISAISAFVSGGALSKSFSVFGQETPHFNFTLTDGRFFIYNADFDIPAGDVLQCLVGDDDSDGAVIDPVVNVEFAWHFTG